jgi:hypothetical protein
VTLVTNELNLAVSERPFTAQSVSGDRQHMVIAVALLPFTHVKAIGALTQLEGEPPMRNILRTVFGALAIAAAVTVGAALTNSSAEAKGFHGHSGASHGHHGMRHSFRHFRSHRYHFSHYRHWHSHYRWRFSRHYHYKHYRHWRWYGHHYRNWRWYGHYRYCDWYRGSYCGRYPYYRSYYGYRTYSAPSYQNDSDGDDAPAPVVRSMPAQAPAQPENCLIKQYLPDGNVLFKDVCTKEEAVTDNDDTPPPPATKGAFRRIPQIREQAR